MFKRIIIFSIFINVFLYTNSYSIKFDLIGKVESIRQDNTITLLFDEKPEKDSYLIIEDDLVLGKIAILNMNAFTINKKIVYRAVAEYFLSQNDKLNIIKTGSVVGLIKEEEKKDAVTAKYEIAKEKSYKQFIITDIDYREMIFIPAGKFLFGSNTGDKNEQPAQIIDLENFYIDKFEVSNSDYSLFVKKTNSKPPASWITGKYNDGEDDFPVMVSYYEAVKYAEWTGKRLPTEEEWEKAARGSEIGQVTKQDERHVAAENAAIYPWGNKFEPSKANSSEFWEAKNTGEETKKQYKKGLLPVYLFKGMGDSIYGVVNMAGNAAEWTSSWYIAYKGNRHSDKLYGKQVKVIRGGAWYNSKQKLRATGREIGGLPNLYIDNIAGFRCVKEPTIIEEKKSE